MQFFFLFFFISPSDCMESFREGCSTFLPRSSPATEVWEDALPWAEPRTELVPDAHQQSLLTSQLCKLFCSLCCSCNTLRALRSFLARHPLRAWPQLRAQAYDCNHLSPARVIKGHNPTKGPLLTIVFKVSLIGRRLQFPESIFLFYFMQKVSHVWYRCANIFNSM